MITASEAKLLAAQTRAKNEEENVKIAIQDIDRAIINAARAGYIFCSYPNIYKSLSEDNRNHIRSMLTALGYNLSGKHIIFNK